jgi:hypothetical protein
MPAATARRRTRPAARKTTPSIGRILQLANPHMEGEDVEYAQQLLTRNPFGNFNPGGVDGEYGDITGAAVYRAKWLLGFKEKDCTLSFGPRLQAYLDGSRQLEADYAKRRKERLARENDEKAIRRRIVEHSLWGVKNTSRIDYDQGGLRLAALGTPRLLPLTTDCSAFTTLCYDWAGAPNPNGGPYNPKATAYTGTMLKHCRKIPQRALDLGDLVIWTPPVTGQHVCVVVSRGPDPWLVSHGQDAGPLKIRLSDEHRAQARNGHGEVTYLSVFPV